MVETHLCPFDILPGIVNGNVFIGLHLYNNHLLYSTFIQNGHVPILVAEVVQLPFGWENTRKYLKGKPHIPRDGPSYRGFTLRAQGLENGPVFP